MSEDKFYPTTSGWVHHERNAYITIRDIPRLARWEYIQVHVIDSVDCVSMVVAWLFKDTNWTADADYSYGANAQLSEASIRVLHHSIENDVMVKSGERYRKLLLNMLREVLHLLADKAVALLNGGNQPNQTIDEWVEEWMKLWSIKDFSEDNLRW